MFLSQIASVCHYLHSKHIVHGNLRAVFVYVESPNKVTFRLYIDWIRQYLKKMLSFTRQNMTKISLNHRVGIPWNIRHFGHISPRIFPDLSKVENNLVRKKLP